MPKVTQLIRIRARTDFRAYIKGVIKEVSMKRYFKKLGAGLRELTED